MKRYGALSEVQRVALKSKEFGLADHDQEVIAAKHGLSVEEYIREKGERNSISAHIRVKQMGTLYKTVEMYSPVHTLAEARANPQEGWARSMLSMVGEANGES